MKKAAILAISFAMIFTLTGISFADTVLYADSIKQDVAENIAECIENIIGTDDVNNDILETKDNYIAESDSLFSENEEIDIYIPKDGDGEIEEVLSEDQISMSLPSEVTTSHGIITDNGTVIFDSDVSDIAIAVQPTKNVTGNEIEVGVRSIITINDESAPHEYSFCFHLPDGCKMISGSELEASDIDDNEIVVINSEGFILAIIKAPWAKDANGNPIDTEYQLIGSTLTQRIEFDETSTFPIMADPWYGTSTQTEDFGSQFEQRFTGYAYSEGSRGYYFDSTGGYISYVEGSRVTVSSTVEVGGGFNAVTLSTGIGVSYEGRTGVISKPVPTNNPGWYKMQVTKVYSAQKYKILRRWKDPDTGRVTWKEYSRNARLVEYYGPNCVPIRVA